MSATEPRVTVIVPVWNGEETIGPCIESLIDQSYPAENLEILVVDNGSTDRTAQIVKSYEKIAYLLEPSPGSYAARNTGLARATGSVIAFIDADCLADRDWIASGVGRIASVPKLGILAGHVEIVRTRTVTAPIFLYERTFSFRQADLARSGKCVTANWMSPKAIFDTVGHFDGSLKSGGDWLLSSQISANGYAVVYVPEMIVRHPTRSNMGELLAKRRRVAGGEWSKSRSRSVYRFLRGSGVDLIKKAVRIWRSSNLSLHDRASITYVLIRANLAFGLEIIRLSRGGEPRRS